MESDYIWSIESVYATISVPKMYSAVTGLS